MTRGEIINARARAGARMVEARAAFTRVKGLRTSAPLVVEAHERAARLAEEEHAAWETIERAHSS